MEAEDINKYIHEPHDKQEPETGDSHKYDIPLADRTLRPNKDMFPNEMIIQWHSSQKPYTRRKDMIYVQYIGQKPENNEIQNESRYSDNWVFEESLPGFFLRKTHIKIISTSDERPIKNLQRIEDLMVGLLVTG